MPEATGNKDVSPISYFHPDIEQRKLFSHSLLESPLQSSLVNEITAQLQTAISQGHPSSSWNMFNRFIISRKRHPLQVYVITSNRIEQDRINPPFKITLENPSVTMRAETSVIGPFDPQLAGAVTYLQQEARMLVASPNPMLNPELKAFAEKHDIQNLHSYGNGMHDLVWKLHYWRETSPQNTREEILQSARKKYQAEVEDDAKRTQGDEEQFGQNINFQDAAYRAIDLASRLQGFEAGILLLDELLAHPWTTSKK